VSVSTCGGLILLYTGGGAYIRGGGLIVGGLRYFKKQNIDLSVHHRNYHHLILQFFTSNTQQLR
jgi:hypothetical protein